MKSGSVQNSLNLEFALSSCTDYLLDMLDVSPGPLPERIGCHWEKFIRVAADQRIYHYLAAWMLEYWHDGIPPQMKESLKKHLERNKARNINVSFEIAELAEIFRAEGIPLMFLKGCAGFVRELYPLEWRMVSDLDVLVKEEDLDRALQLLRSKGYLSSNDKITFGGHHVAPHSHPDKLAEIELHFKYYSYASDWKDYKQELWSRSETISFYSGNVTVPSVTDHLWILMRTDLLARVCIPRLKDAIEASLILSSGYKVDFNILSEKADKANTSNLLHGLMYCYGKYIDEDAVNRYSIPNLPHIEKWERWSMDYRRRNVLDDDHLYKFEKEFAAWRYYPGNFSSMIKFVAGLMKTKRMRYLSVLLKVLGLHPTAKKIKYFIFPVKKPAQPAKELS